MTRISTALRLCLAFLAAFALTPAFAEPTHSPARTVVPLDSGWTFNRGDSFGAEGAAFDDKEWQEVTLPHTYNGPDGDDGGGFYRGPAWYRRSFDVASLSPGRRVFIQFDGAALATDVWVNGRHLGRHEGGHAGFRFDVTPALVEGLNRLSVRVDNTRLPSIAPLGGDFTVFGGLYRRVFLIETADTHVDMLDHGGPGVYASSTIGTDGSAAVSIRTRLRNDARANRRLILSAAILDADGRSVAREETRLALGSNASQEAVLRARIASPRLWQGRKDPHAYRVVTELRDARTRRLLDNVTVPHGVRTVAADPVRGFMLNGQPYPLHGANMFHSGRPGRGLAVTDEEIAQDVQILDELGVTGIRFVHFQHPPRAYEETDRRGIAVWTEIGLNGAIDPSQAFEANVAQQMRELIRQNYNHPSVVYWGLGNEVYAVNPDVTRMLRTAQRVAKEEDPTRPTIYAHCCQEDDIEKAMVADITAFNRYFGWYPGQDGTIGTWADGFRAKHPNRPFNVGEYGGGASIRQQQNPAVMPDTAGAWHPEAYQTLYHEANWRELRERRNLAGTFIWVAFDLASDGRNEGDRAGINDKGIITYDRMIRKDAYYWYQANWSPRPMLYIAERRHDWREQPRVEVKVYSNAPQVTLTHNGRNLGTVPVVDHIALFRGLELQPGDNIVQASSSRDGQALADQVTWRYEPAGSILTGDKQPRVLPPPPPEEQKPATKPPGQ